MRLAIWCLTFALYSCPLQAKEARTVQLNEKTVADIRISPGFTTVLSFPTKPTKVILGNRGLFGIEYVESDVAISALSPSAKSNMYVYLDGRRFAFSLATVPIGGDEIVLVRDNLAGQEKVKLK